MSIVKLYDTIGRSKSKNMLEFAEADTVHDMMGFSPIETVVNDVVGSKNKNFRVGKLI